MIAVEKDIIELTNGCICCTINDNLADAVYRVLERPDQLDYLIVETTGIADPLPIALTFLGTDLRNYTQLDAILTLVDVSTFTSAHYFSDAAHYWSRSRGELCQEAANFCIIVRSILLKRVIRIAIA